MNSVIKKKNPTKEQFPFCFLKPENPTWECVNYIKFYRMLIKSYNNADTFNFIIPYNTWNYQIRARKQQLLFFFLRVEASQFVFNFASEQMATFAVIIFHHKRLIDSLVVGAFTSYGENLSSDSCFESNKAGFFLR